MEVEELLSKRMSNPLESTWARWHAASQTLRNQRADEVAARCELVPDGLNDAGLATFLDRRKTSRRFVLIPGIQATLGWIPGPLTLTKEQRDAWVDATSRLWGDDRRPEDQVAGAMGPRRIVSVPAALAQSEATDTKPFLETADGDVGPQEDPVDILERALAEQGLALPSPDAWEAWYRGGSNTMFPWGDDWNRPKRYVHPWGLVFSDDTYLPELVAGRALRNGDGGVSACGGAPEPYILHAQASAYAVPDELVDDDWWTWLDNAQVRPVLDPSSLRSVRRLEEDCPIDTGAD